MHTVHSDVVKLEPRAPEEAGYNASHQATLHILLVRNQCAPMSRSRAKVRAVCAHVDTTHPTACRAAWPRESEGLGDPFPIASCLQKGEVGHHHVFGKPVFDIIISECCTVMTKGWASALRKASEAASNDVKQGVESHAALAQFPFRDCKQDVPLVPNLNLAARNDVH